MPRGGVVSVIGPNGAGKSTLLNSLMGLLHARGRIVFDGESLSGMPLEERVMRGMALVPEKRELFGSMAVEDNLVLGGYRQMRRGVANWRDAIERVYALFPRLHERRAQLAGTLSGGERQMLAVGRALMADPKLLMLDEPSLGLAPLVVREVFRTIERLREAGASILLIEQNARAALEVSDYAYVLETGALALEGPARELARDPRVIDTYLGSAAIGMSARAAPMSTGSTDWPRPRRAPTARSSFGVLRDVLGFHITLANIATVALFERHVGGPFNLRKAEFSLLMLLLANGADAGQAPGAHAAAVVAEPDDADRPHAGQALAAPRTQPGRPPLADDRAVGRGHGAGAPRAGRRQDDGARPAAALEPRRARDADRAVDQGRGASRCRRRARRRRPDASGPLIYFQARFEPRGVVVQLVRIPACHAGGRGFESRPLRQITRKYGPCGPFAFVAHQRPHLDGR